MAQFDYSDNIKICTLRNTLFWVKILTALYLTYRRGGLREADGPALQHTHQQPGARHTHTQGIHHTYSIYVQYTLYIIHIYIQHTYVRTLYIYIHHTGASPGEYNQKWASAFLP